MGFWTLLVYEDFNMTYVYIVYGNIYIFVLYIGISDCLCDLLNYYITVMISITPSR